MEASIAEAATVMPRMCSGTGAGNRPARLIAFQTEAGQQLYTLAELEPVRIWAEKWRTDV
jgi:hypothetical protein